jgi:predicted nucleic acid-binding protein
VSRIFWDSNLFIYLFEDNPEFSNQVDELRRKMLLRGDQLFTSTLTLGEILVKPMAMGDQALCSRYENILGATATIIPFGIQTPRHYAAVRTKTKIKGPDAIQLACASEARVDLFITNDHRLEGKMVEGIQFIVALDQVPF